MKKFNLMQIIPELNSGGVEKGTIDLANYLAQKNINNFIVSNGGKMLPLLNKKFVTHYHLSVHSKNFLRMPFVSKKINSIINKENISLIHLRSRAPAWLLPYINKKNIKTISTFHNVYGTQNFLKKLYNKQLGNVDKIIAISEYVKNEISKIYKIDLKKIKVINRGSDEEFFDAKTINDEKFYQFINKKNINIDNKIILFPGRLTQWKGQIEFLNLIEEFKNEPVIFYFPGDDKNISYYKKLLSEINKKGLNNKCRIMGNLNSEELKMMYQCSDLIISAPLQPEGFGRTISEALLMNKIVLAYNYGGVKNQLDDLPSIYKITPLDLNEMKNKILSSLNLEQEKILQLGYEGRKHIIKHFSKKNMLSSYQKFYEEIVN